MHQEFVVLNPLNPPYQGAFKRKCVSPIYSGLADDPDLGSPWKDTFDKLTHDVGYYLMSEPHCLITWWRTKVTTSRSPRNGFSLCDCVIRNGSLCLDWTP